MDIRIVCPKCRKLLMNNTTIEDAIKGDGDNTQSILCDCGEKITYWQITAQLRDQKTIGRRFQNWFQERTHTGIKEENKN
jgi:RNase P subunit RPR2